MVKRSEILEFDWDEGNIDKNYQKHGITPDEAEEIFVDNDLQVSEDVKHSEREERLIAVGKTTRRKVLFVVFTMRKYKIRIISARIAHTKERRGYEEAIKKNS